MVGVKEEVETEWLTGDKPDIMVPGDYSNDDDEGRGSFLGLEGLERQNHSKLGY